MGNDVEKIILGGIFFIGGILYLFNLPEISRVDEFSYTLCAFFFSLASLFSNPLDIDRVSVYKVIFYILGFSCLILMPQFENNESMIVITNSINGTAFLMFSLGLAFLSMYFNNRDKKQLLRKLEQEKQEAVINERKKITEELYDRVGGSQ